MGPNCDLRLASTHVFGIRRYNPGAVLKPHRDRGRTQVASVIINVDQEVDQPWPLLIEDPNCRRYHLLLALGEILF
ncbi:MULTISPECIES: hypothetical protein [Microbulbifer]|uniref:hypothetical protein n=1 Tax=Microbulbifer TaxID=48073 RepID=UPI001F1C36BE|nr:hypothetical protein [Microbulbifer zhoushanensis]